MGIYLDKTRSDRKKTSTSWLNDSSITDHNRLIAGRAAGRDSNFLGMRRWHRAAAEARGGGDDSSKTGHNRF